MARHGSRVSATTVMNSLRTAGALCAEEDAALAEDLFANGVTPPGEIESEQVLVEADGTWVSLQGVAEGEPDRVEIKALVAYGSKEKAGKKTRAHGLRPPRLRRVARRVLGPGHRRHRH
ncbi:MAG: hypothetical protein ACLTDR_16725 [Adlercreutzia equolifaciens]